VAVQFSVEEELRLKFLIPPKLVGNWDQTGCHYVPSVGRSRAVQGVEVATVGAEDKRQITVVLAAAEDIHPQAQDDQLADGGL